MISLRSFSFVLFLFLSFNLLGQEIHSFQNGDWDNVATWAGGVIPDIDSESIHIHHIVTVSSGITVDGVEVSSGGTLIIATDGLLTIPNVANAILVEGTLQGNEGSQILGAIGNNISFSNASSYIHNFSSTEGTIPVANWDANSTIRVQGYISPPTVFVSPTWSQSFGNFVWECASQTGIINLSGLLNNEIKGSMQIENTGSSFLRLSAGQTFALSVGNNLEINNTAGLQLTLSGQATLTVGEDFYFESTLVGGSETNTTGQGILDVQGNFVMDAPSGLLSLGSGSGGGVGTLRVGGDFSLINGTITESGSDPKRGRIEFVGNGVFDFINQGSLSGSLEYFIGADTDLNLSTYKLIGNADSSIEVDGTVRVGATDPQGTIVAASGVGPGNIRVASRIFNPGSRIIYNGTSAQIIGSGHPIEDGVDMVVQNSNGVYFNSASNFTNLHLGGSLMLESGNFYIDSNPSPRSVRLSGALQANGHNLIFNGDQCDLTIDGTGAFESLPATGDQIFRNLTMNRVGENLILDQNVSVTGTVSVGGGSLLFNGAAVINQIAMTGGNMELSQNTTIPGASSISGGILSFEDVALTVQSQFDVSGGFLQSNENSDLVINGTGLIGNLAFTPESWLKSLYLQRLLGGELGTIGYIRVTETVNLVNGILRNNGVFELAENATITTSNISGVVGTPLTGGSYHVVYIGTANISPTGAELPLGLPVASITVQASNPNVSVQVANDVEVLGDIDVLMGGINFSGHSVTCSNIQNEGTFVSGSGLLHVNGNVINNGSFHAPTADGLFQLIGDFENSGTFYQIGGTIDFIGSSHFNGNAPDFRNIIISGEFFAPPEFIVRGDFTNNGVFHTQNSAVTFSGETQTPQVINGSSLSTFHHVEINNVVAKPGVRVQSDLHISGILSLGENVEFDADGSSNNAVLTLLSIDDSPTQDAAIGILPASATILGDITIQRYMSIEGSNNNRIYRYLSSSISNASVLDLQNEIPITGNFEGSSQCPGCSNATSMFAYNETITTDADGNGIANLNDGYQSFPILDNTEQLDVGRGYAVFVRGNILQSPVWDVRGTINRGEVDFNIAFTASGNSDNDGWNLIGNPYPSAIDFNSETGWTKEHVEAAIYFRDNGNTPERFASWNGEVGTNGGTGIIPIGQGFWVKASGEDPELIANENVKTPGVSSIFFREESIPNLLRIKLDPGEVGDEAVVYFRDGATNKFDPQFDAHKLKNNSSNIASSVDIQKPLAINAMAPFQCEAKVNVLISEVSIGNHVLQIENHENFPADIEIFLFDKYAGEEFNVRDAQEIHFIITNDPMSMAVDRFSLQFKSYENPVIELGQAILCENASMIVKISGNGSNTYAIVNEEEIIVSNSILGDIDLEIMADQLHLGSNELYVSVTSPSCSSYLSTPFEIRVEPIPVINEVFNGNVCLAGSVVLAVQFSGDYLNWYDCERCENPIYVSNHEFEIEVNKSTEFYVEAISTSGCQSGRVAVTATVIDFEPIEISQHRDSLVSNYAEGNQWYFQGSLIGTLPYLLPNQSGTYLLQNKVEQCLTVDTMDFEWNKKLFVVYPNPVANQMTISSSVVGSHFEITMRDILGKEVMYGSGLNELVLDLEYVASGYYWLKISTPDFSQTMVIQKK